MSKKKPQQQNICIKLPEADRSHVRLVQQMVFSVDRVQMKFLHLLSTEASHHITLYCKTEPSDDSSSARSTPQEDTEPRFFGWNKQTFQKDTLLEPHVLQDDCKVTCQMKQHVCCCVLLSSCAKRQFRSGASRLRSWM